MAAARQASSLASVYNVFMIDANQYVPVHAFDVLLTDLSAKEISETKIDNHEHLSPVTGEKPGVLRGIALGENARVLVRACVLRPSSSSCPSLNVMMLVATGSPYVFFSEKTWKALGVKIEDFPGGQASVEINGTKVLGHASSNHFADIDVLGVSFLKQK